MSPYITRYHDKVFYEPLKEGVRTGFSATVLAGRGPLVTDENFNDIHLISYKLLVLSVWMIGVRAVLHPPNTITLPTAEVLSVLPGGITSFHYEATWCIVR